MRSTHDDDDAAAGPAETVPVGFARRVRRLRDELQPFSFEGLRQRLVDVHAHGFVYRGVLLGVGDDTVYLRMEHKSIELPLSDVSKVVADGHTVALANEGDQACGASDDEP